MSGSTSSLKLLCESYQSDDENEDTNTSNQSQQIQPNEKVETLPLPESIRNLFVTTEEVTDDAELHRGRVRSFPHERGNWVTSVYISYDTKQLNRICDKLINNCCEIGDFHSCDDFHVSLSRTVILRHHWIDIFVDDLRKAFKNVKSFYADVGELAVFVNDEKTRTFVGLKIEHGYSELLKCVQLVDKSLLEFKLPLFYEDPEFHVSLVWCLGNKRKQIEDTLPNLQTNLDKLNATESTLIRVNEISCKIGNRFYSFALS